MREITYYPTEVILKKVVHIPENEILKECIRLEFEAVDKNNPLIDSMLFLDYNKETFKQLWNRQLKKHILNYAGFDGTFHDVSVELLDENGKSLNEPVIVEFPEID